MYVETADLTQVYVNIKNLKIKNSYYITTNSEVSNISLFQVVPNNIHESYLASPHLISYPKNAQFNAELKH